MFIGGFVMKDIREGKNPYFAFDEDIISPSEKVKRDFIAKYGDSLICWPSGCPYSRMKKD